ncbi:MAG: WG repeat-containing protein [Bacteroidales bacterium]|nr:WG repeat-containing protein [Bacteroidales bacterium]
MSNKAHRELSFIKNYNSETGVYKEVSGLIKDKVFYWPSDDNKAYVMSSVKETSIHKQYVKKGRMRVFDYRSRTIISKDGFFYGKFDCEYYEYVERIYDTNYYVCRKNDVYGVIDDNKKNIIDIVYPLITILPLKNDHLSCVMLKITTNEGEYLMELTSMKKSKSYNKIYTFGSNYLVETNELYGLLSPIGEEIVQPLYPYAYPLDERITPNHIIDERYINEGACLAGEYNDKWGSRTFIANNGKYYGIIPMEYDECYIIMDDNYLVNKNGKYGLIWSLLGDIQIIIPVNYTSIFFDEHAPFYRYWRERGKPCISFAIVQDEKGYQLYDIVSKVSVGEHYQSLNFTYNRDTPTDYREGRYAPFFIAKRNNKFGLISQFGVPLTDFIFQSMRSMINNVFPVCKDNKWGIINEWGNQLIECVWDEIKNISIGKTIVIKDGQPIEIELNNRSKKTGVVKTSTYERPTFERYAGSYAQDEMGFSDDDIDEIFEGDPSAYWNID